MENRWILHVKNLGKIEAASIAVAPIVLFVGDNNSGKSYLMEVLYALLNVRFLRQNYDFCTETEEYGFCAEWLKNSIHSIQERNLVISLSESVLQNFILLLNHILKKNKAKLANQAFNANVSIGDLSLEFPELRDIKIRISSVLSSARHMDADKKTDFILRPVLQGRSYTGARFRRKEGGRDEFDFRFLIGHILEFLIKNPFKTNALADAVFLPTSRTGFLLLYRTVVNESLAQIYDIDEEKSNTAQLTRPCSDFLKNLSDVSPEDATDEFDPVIRFIENTMVHGRLSLSGDTPQKTINYIPDDSEVDLPMYLSSGVVTELAPLLLMLRYHQTIETLFIEEPEMGLHPELQLAMARVLLRLCSGGTSLLITTHSDTILQHINNMIKLNDLPKSVKAPLMEKYGYEDGDLISPEEIAMYQLDTAKGKTTITALTSNEYGFEIPTFNNTLENLLKQTVSFQRDEENDGD